MHPSRGGLGYLFHQREVIIWECVIYSDNKAEKCPSKQLQTQEYI